MKKKTNRVVLYSLSTCVWCNRTKRLLNQLGVAYTTIDVDLLDDDEELAVREKLDRINPRGGFPVIVINNSKIITGFQEDRIYRELSRP